MNEDKQKPRGIFSSSELAKLGISSVAFFADVITTVSFLSNPDSFFISQITPKSRIIFVIVLFVLVVIGTTFLLGALAQRYKRLNSDEYKWEYITNRVRGITQETRVRRKSYMQKQIIEEELGKLGKVVFWIGFLPYVAWCIFFFSSIPPIFLAYTGETISSNSFDGIGVLILFFSVFLFFIYLIVLQFSKQMVMNLFSVL